MIRWFVPRFMFPICLFLWSAAAVAQTGSISGSVVDQTGLLLPGATVTLRGEGGPRTAYADEQGNFELSGVASGTYALTVSLAGFSDAVVEDVTVGGAALDLPPVELQLARFSDTIVVTASRAEGRLLDAPVSTYVITASTLETTPARNYGDLLRATPGVNVIQLSARDVQVSSRSPGNTLTNTQLVLVDGRSAYLDFFGLVLWDLVPTNFEDIEQIEVVRGPASAVHFTVARVSAGQVAQRQQPRHEATATTHAFDPSASCGSRRQRSGQNGSTRTGSSHGSPRSRARRRQAWRRSSTLRSDSGKRTYIITARRMISGEVLK